MVEGQVVLITGGAGGFGKAFAEGFLKRKAKVCLADYNEELGKKVETELAKRFGQQNVIFIKCDVTCNNSFENCFTECEAKLGKLNILINNAGIFNEKDFEKTINVNMIGTIRGSELALKRMGKHNGGKGGKIINVASAAGFYCLTSAPFYTASKGGVVHYTRVMGVDSHYNYSGVTMQCLCPSFADTPIIRGGPSQLYNEYFTRLSSTFEEKNMLLKPEEVTDALFKLLEDGKNGGVLGLEHNKEPYYVEAFKPK